MEYIYWLLIGLIAYSYIGYPIVIVLLSLVIRNPVNSKDIEPSVTFLITAYNEEKDIAQKLLNTLALDYPKEKLEIIVASDASSDNTDDIVRGFATRGVRLVRIEGRVGKTEVQNQAVRCAHGSVIIFSDATTNYDPQVIRKIVRNYNDPHVGAVSGRYQYFDPSKSQVGAGTVAFWDYENFIKIKQSQIATITGCCGCIYSVRRDRFIPLPRDIISDLVEPLKVLENGSRIVFEQDAVAFETTCQDSKEEFKMRVRVISRGMNGLLFMKKLFNPLRYPFISFQLISHKVLRWLIPFFLVGLFLVNCFILNKSFFYRITIILQVCFYAIALIDLMLDRFNKKIPLLGLPLYFCVVNVASMLALIKTILGHKAVSWETVRK